MDTDDQALIERCRAGDLAAFEPLVEKYRQRAWRVAYQIVRDREDAQDVCQEAFIRAYRSLGSFRGHSAFYTWFFRIVVNLATDRVRQRAARGRALGTEPLTENDLQGVLPDHATAPPDDEAARRQERRRIAEGLDALPPKFRTIIILSDVEGLSYREMAEVLSIPVGTVMSRLHTARKRLRTLLKPLLVLAVALVLQCSGDPAFAQQVVRFDARILLATESPVVAQPLPPDPSDEYLARVLARMRGLFRYRAYTTLERLHAEVPIGSPQRWPVPGDRQLEVMPEVVTTSSVRVRLRLLRGHLVELNANIRSQPGHPTLIGGPPHNDGVLIIVIWADPTPSQ